MADTFGADITAWASEAQFWTSQQCAQTVRKLYKRVVFLSPNQFVGKYSQGHFNKNWRIGPTAVQGEIAGNTTVVEKHAEIDRIIDDEYFLLNNQVTMTNSTEYVNEIEYVGWKKRDGSPGHPAYAPVAKAIAEVL